MGIRLSMVVLVVLASSLEHSKRKTECKVIVAVYNMTDIAP